MEATVFLFEIPTGIVADTISRKRSIIIGYILMGVGFIIEGLFPYFYSIAAAQVIWGIGYTFTSGAKQAWITDELGEEKASGAFIKAEQARQAGDLIAIPVSIAVGMIALNLPIVMGGIFMIILAVFLAAAMQERGFKPKPRDRTSPWGPLIDTVKSARLYIKGHHMLILLFATGLFYGLYSEGFDRLWTAHLVENFTAPIIASSNPVVFIGLFRTVLILLSAFSLGMLNKKLDLNKKSYVIRVLILSSIVIITALAGFSAVNSLYIAIALF